MLYLQKSLVLYRKDQYSYPKQALREALINSIVHREYGMKGSTIISIFDDRIEFLNPGGLVVGMTFKDLVIEMSICRNEYLANLFYRLQLIEAYGSGLSRIFHLYEGTNKNPLIEISDHAFKITLYNLNYESKDHNNNMFHEDVVFNGMVLNEEDEYHLINHYMLTHYSFTSSEIEALLHTSQATSNRILKRW